MTQDTNDWDAVAGVVVDAIKAAVAPLKARIADLETRTVGPEYKGTFEIGHAYSRGSLVTRGGGLWLALSDTTLTPGSSPTAWRLIVKSGGAARSDERVGATLRWSDDARGMRVRHRGRDGGRPYPCVHPDRHSVRLVAG
jgi:hypothetical protein